MLVETTNQETTKWVKIDYLWQNHFKVLEIVIQCCSRCDRLSLASYASLNSITETADFWKPRQKSDRLNKLKAISYLFDI